MAGADHAAGAAITAATSHTTVVPPAEAAHSPCCHDGLAPGMSAHTDPASGPSLATIVGWTGGTHDDGGHNTSLCVMVLGSLALLAALAAAAATVGPPISVRDQAWLRVRLRRPTALLRPSLSQLCVLRI